MKTSVIGKLGRAALAVWCCAIAGKALAAPIPANPGYVSFLLNAQPGSGRISYDGSAGGPLVGQDLGVLAVQGVGTPGNADQLIRIENGTLNFQTGAHQTPPAAGRSWTFDAGGRVTITGGIASLGIADGTPLLSGSFRDATLVDNVGPNGLKVQSAAFFNTIHPDLAAYLGLPRDGSLPYQGGLALLFAAPGQAPAGFQSDGYTSGQLTTTPVPEPGAWLVFGVIAAGGLAWRRAQPRP